MRYAKPLVILALLAAGTAALIGCDFTPVSGSAMLVLSVTETSAAKPVRVTVALDGNTLISGDIQPGQTQRIVLLDPADPQSQRVEIGEHRLTYKLYRAMGASGNAELSLESDERPVLLANTGGVAAGFWRQGTFRFDLREGKLRPATVKPEAMPLLGKGQIVESRTPSGVPILKPPPGVSTSSGTDADGGPPTAAEPGPLPVDWGPAPGEQPATTPSAAPPPAPLALRMPILKDIDPPGHGLLHPSSDQPDVAAMLAPEMLFVPVSPSDRPVVETRSNPDDAGKPKMKLVLE
ncbi:MAG: hypothetical protein BIFFINMI_02302 [Phycisphaerae bacterium]|nr:hypothetical protein [Phycisphaerae bacterium]